MFRDEFLAFQREHLQSIGGGHWWTQPGECLMSGTDTLDDNNGVMILGLNPGGGNDGSRLPPLCDQIREFCESRPEHFSAYLDQCWHYTNTQKDFKGFPQATCGACAQTEPADEDAATVHQVPHQERVSAVARRLGIDLRKTVALNALWLQTPSASDLASQVAAMGAYVPPFDGNRRPTITDVFESLYLPVIRFLIAGAGIRHVLCLGNAFERSSFRLLAAHRAAGPDTGAGPRAPWDRPYHDGRNFPTKDLRVFGLPHPSRHTLSRAGYDALVAWYERGRVMFDDAGRRRTLCSCPFSGT